MTATIRCMKVIIGLGNPGEEYTRTRHNVGFLVLDAYAQRMGVSFKTDKKVYSELYKSPSVALIKPTTFMNDSGLAVRSFFDYYKTGFTKKDGESLWVVHDDLDIALGSYKIQFGTGPKVHNGLLSLYEHLGTHDFWHVRVGVENRGAARAAWPAREYVLGSFTEEENKTLSALIPEIVERLQ